MRFVEFAEESKVRGVSSRLRIIAYRGRLVVAVGCKDAEDLIVCCWKRDSIHVTPIGGGGEDEDARRIRRRDSFAYNSIVLRKTCRNGDDVDFVPGRPFDRLGGEISESCGKTSQRDTRDNAPLPSDTHRAQRSNNPIRRLLRRRHLQAHTS
jgi:hypothetical protein